MGRRRVCVSRGHGLGPAHATLQQLAVRRMNPRKYRDDGRSSYIGRRRRRSNSNPTRMRVCLFSVFVLHNRLGQRLLLARAARDDQGGAGDLGQGGGRADVVRGVCRRQEGEEKRTQRSVEAGAEGQTLDHEKEASPSCLGVLTAVRVGLRMICEWTRGSMAHRVGPL